MSSGIIDTIKRVALNAYEASNPIKVLFGKVISTDPVKIQVSDVLTLTREFLVINGAVFEGDMVTLIRIQGGQKYVVLGTRTEYTEHTIYVGGVVGNTVVDRAISWAVGIANSNAHGYDQSKRWGPNYDCSSLIITAYENAGVPVKSQGGASYTGNMYKAFLRCGFKNVTGSVSRVTGKGMKKGDVLLRPNGHTAMVIEDDGKRIVHASFNEKGKSTGGKSGDQTGKEITTRSYYNSPWTYVLRYQG